MKLYLVKIDETKYWTNKELVNSAGKIYCVYLFDKESCTHCCELTPSYSLEPLYRVTDCEISEGDEETIQVESMEQMYVHCSDIDQRTDLVHVDMDYDPDESPEYNFEQAREYCQANHKI